MKTESNPTHMPAVQIRDHLGDRAPYHALVTVSMDREGLVHLSAHRDGDDRDSTTTALTIDQAARVYALLGRAIGAQAIDVEHLRNEARTWPDWRTAEPGKAIEHDRSKERDGTLGHSTACLRSPEGAYASDCERCTAAARMMKPPAQCGDDIEDILREAGYKIGPTSKEGRR